jgi:23S rRNA (uracil1939-C5)-methyltransferase
MKPGDTLTVMAETLSKHGDGVARQGGIEIHVAGLLPGETGDVEIDYVSRQKPRAHARVVLRRNTHPGRRPAPCRHHGRCNGCGLMDMDLPSQRQLKRVELERTYGIFIDRMVGETLDGRGYRHSSKRVFAGSPGHIRLGSYMRGTHNVADMGGCLVDHPDIAACADELVQAADAVHAVPYDETDGEGDLRYAWFKADGRGRVLLAIITAEPCHTAVHEVASRLTIPVGIAWGVNARMGNDMRGTTLRPLRGRQSIEIEFADPLRDEAIVSHVGALGFLQPNPQVASLAYHDLVRVPAGGALHGRTALDLYAGAGVTTRLLRRHFQMVAPCESFPESARALGAEPELVEEFLARILADPHHLHRHPELVVANPPRGGLGPTVCEQLNTLAVPRLHIMSCSPGSLVEDLRRLTGEHGRYKLIGARAFDTLPQTNHIEVVVWLVGRS